MAHPSVPAPGTPRPPRIVGVAAVPSLAPVGDLREPDPTLQARPGELLPPLPAGQAWARVDPRLAERGGRWSRGGGWTAAGTLFLLFGWAIWVTAHLRTPPLYLVVPIALTVIVAFGLFALLRLIGRHVWHGVFGRARRTARLSHVGVGLFLAATGIGFLAQTPWVMDLATWVRDTWA